MNRSRIFVTYTLCVVAAILKFCLFSFSITVWTTTFITSFMLLHVCYIMKLCYNNFIILCYDNYHNKASEKIIIITKRSQNMDLEGIRAILQSLTKKKITNSLLSDALSMKLPNVSRKIKDRSSLKLQQFKQLEDYFSVDLSKYYDNNHNEITKKEITQVQYSPIDKLLKMPAANNHNLDFQLNLYFDELKKIILFVEEWSSKNKLSPLKKAEIITKTYKMYVKGSLTEITAEIINDICEITMT